MFARVRKAVIADAGAFLAGLVTATVQKGAAPGWPEVAAAALAGVGVGWAAWRVPNAAPVAPEGVTGTYVGGR